VTRFTLKSNLTIINNRRGEVHPRPRTFPTHSSTLQNNTEQFTRLSHQIIERSATSSIPKTLWSNLLAFLPKLPSALPCQLTLYQSLTLFYTRCYAANTRRAA
jgi:hypothetical protein